MVTRKNPFQGARERQMSPGVPGHGRLTRAAKRLLPTTTLARGQAGGTSPTRRRAARQNRPSASTACRAGDASRRGGAGSPLSAASASKSADNSTARSPKRCRQDRTVRSGTPRKSLAEPSGRATPAGAIDNRCPDGRRAVPAPGQDEVREQGLPLPAAVAAGTSHGELVELAGFAYRTGVAAVEGHRHPTARTARARSWHLATTGTTGLLRAPACRLPYFYIDRGVLRVK